MGKNWISDWKIIPVGSVSITGYRLYRIMGAASPPPSITWSIDPDGEYERKRIMIGGSDYGEWPVPTTPGHVCVFDPRSGSFGDVRASGLGWLYDDVASCVYRPGSESDLSIGLRIWHEVLHCMIGTGEPDEMTQSPGFITYLKESFGTEDAWVLQFEADPSRYAHDSGYQKVFYKYLVEKHFRDEACAPGKRPPLQYLVLDMFHALDAWLAANLKKLTMVGRGH